AFDFMEAAFSSGQEMLVFVTGLTMRKEAAVFLAANPCERNFKYNEELLAGTKKGEILKHLNSWC
ncbi:MAG: ATPase, partial [Roseburia sp.]|nr:ATPase [Roseburia sp.]